MGHMQFSRTIGYCIYCGSKDGRLTKEHVVPRGLGGNRKIDGFHHAPVLKAASCDICQKITHSVEEYCLQDMFDPIRIRLGLKQSAPPSKILTRLTLLDGTGVERMEDPTSATAVLTLPLFAEAPRHLEPETPRYIRLTSATIFPTPTQPDKSDAIVAHNSKIDVKLYERMIAKMGLGLAICKHGPHKISSLVGKFIRGEEADGYGKYVFGVPLDKGPSNEETSIMFTVEEKALNGVTYVFSYIRLFPLFGTPTHGVLVGTINEEIQEK